MLKSCIMLYMVNVTFIVVDRVIATIVHEQNSDLLRCEAQIFVNSMLKSVFHDKICGSRASQRQRVNLR